MDPTNREYLTSQAIQVECESLATDAFRISVIEGSEHVCPGEVESSSPPILRQAQDVKYPKKVERWPNRFAAVRYPEKAGCRPDRIAAVRHQVWNWDVGRIEWRL